GRDRICGQPTRDRHRVSCWCGMVAVRAAARGLSAAAQQPVPPANGMGEGARLTGGRMAVLSAGLRMAGKGSLRIGSGDPAAALSTIHSPLNGEARQAGGVIRKLRGADGVRRRDTVTAEPDVLNAPRSLLLCGCARPSQNLAPLP